MPADGAGVVVCGDTEEGGAAGLVTVTVLVSVWAGGGAAELHATANPDTSVSDVRSAAGFAPIDGSLATARLPVGFSLCPLLGLSYCSCGGHTTWACCDCERSGLWAARSRRVQGVTRSRWRAIARLVQVDWRHRWRFPSRHRRRRDFAASDAKLVRP
jgi:hypothetical protein